MKRFGGAPVKTSAAAAAARRPKIVGGGGVTKISAAAARRDRRRALRQTHILRYLLDVFVYIILTRFKYFYLI